MSISFKSFIYRALASKASFTKALASKASFTELHLQSSSFESFIYKSSSFKSFIYRALASKASFTKALASKASFTELKLQSFTCKASPTKLQCRVYKYRLRTTASSAHTWIQFEVSSQQTLLTKDLGDYIMYHISGLNWAS
ncbi:hypothetical protein ACFX11_046063 [Malus domestica]